MIHVMAAGIAGGMEMPDMFDVVPDREYGIALRLQHPRPVT